MLCYVTVQNAIIQVVGGRWSSRQPNGCPQWFLSFTRFMQLKRMQIYFLSFFQKWTITWDSIKVINKVRLKHTNKNNLKSNYKLRTLVYCLKLSLQPINEKGSKSCQLVLMIILPFLYLICYITTKITILKFKQDKGLQVTINAQGLKTSISLNAFL